MSFNFISCSFLMRMLQYFKKYIFFPPKKLPSKVAHNWPQMFFSVHIANRPKIRQISYAVPQIGLINSGAFGIFSAKPLAPILVQ